VAQYFRPRKVGSAAGKIDLVPQQVARPQKVICHAAGPFIGNISRADDLAQRMRSRIDRIDASLKRGVVHSLINTDRGDP
jgi:hypothetical protein